MYAEGQGYHVLGSEQQRTKLKASETDALLGRKPSEIPARLSKVLYIPKHGSSQFHLPLYDVSNEFRKTIGDALIGSSLFTTKLAMMDTPSGEGTDAEVRYLIDLEKRPVGGSEEVVAKIQRRALGDVDGQVTM